MVYHGSLINMVDLSIFSMDLVSFVDQLGFRFGPPGLVGGHGFRKDLL